MSMIAKQLNITRVKTREEERLIKLARKAGYFDCRVSSENVEAMFRMFISANAMPQLSQLARLELQMKNAKRQQSEQARKEDTRRKILLGSFLMAQMEHKPVLKAELMPELKQFLELHKDPNAVERNKALLNDWLVLGPANLQPPETEAAT